MHLSNEISGWVDINNLIDENDLKPQVLYENTGVEHTYSDTQDYDSKVTFQTDDGKTVDVNILDNNGNLVSNGTIVVGSDGNKYEIANIKISEVEGSLKLALSLFSCLLPDNDSLLPLLLNSYDINLFWLSFKPSCKYLIDSSLSKASETSYKLLLTARANCSLRI